jgi:hypothetical protein
MMSPRFSIESRHGRDEDRSRTAVEMLATVPRVGVIATAGDRFTARGRQAGGREVYIAASVIEPALGVLDGGGGPDRRESKPARGQPVRRAWLGTGG